MSDDDRHRLHPLREGVAPDADPAFRGRLESQLRVAHAERSGRVPWWSGRPRTLIVVPALSLVLLAATVALVARDESAVAAIELRDATNVVVTLPDGAEVRDPEDGFRLTDGAVVRVGAGGAVTIDDVTLSEGTVITVRDGSLVTDVVGTTTTPPLPDRPATTTTTVRRSDTAAPTTTLAPVPTVAPERPGRDDPPPSLPPVEPAPTDRPRETLPPEPQDPPVDPPVTTLPPVPEGGGGDDGKRDDDVVPVSLALRLFAEDGKVRVVWRVEGLAADEPREVVVVRTVDGTDPDWPLGTGAVVGEGTTGEIVERRADLPDDLVSLRYRVIVLDGAGGAVARGAVQTLHSR